MAAGGKNSLAAKKTIKNNWVAQALKVTVLSPVAIEYRNLGIQTMVNETSKKEKFQRK